MNKLIEIPGVGRFHPPLDFERYAIKAAAIADPLSQMHDEAAALSATARQLCEAILRTVGKWKESAG
jgi:hypothetical protein